MADVENVIGFVCTPRVDRKLRRESLGFTCIEDYRKFLIVTLKFIDSCKFQYCDNSHLIILFRRFLAKSDLLKKSDDHVLYEYLEKIQGILSGSLINTAIVLNKYLKTISHNTRTKVITPFSLNDAISDDQAYNIFLVSNGVKINSLVESDAMMTGTVQSFHFDLEDDRYILCGVQRKITQMPDFEEKLNGLRKIVMEGFTYIENQEIFYAMLVKAKEMGIGVDFTLSSQYITMVCKEQILEHILNKRINIIIGSTEEIITLLSDEQYSEISDFAKKNYISMLEIMNTNNVRFIDNNGTQTIVSTNQIHNLSISRSRDFFLSGFYLGQSLDFDIQTSLNIGVSLAALNIEIPDIFFTVDKKLLKIVNELISSTFCSHVLKESMKEYHSKESSVLLSI
ncbi:MAG: hypothetical protein PHY80_02995 [Rickettsiales bacterium]|nr:hypothetical protein [Rickettsiales bacterium]